MLQKYYPIVGEVNSPLAACAALNLTPEAVNIVISGVSNEVLESLLFDAVKETAVYRKEVEVSASELTVARKIAVKTLRTLRYRAAQAARAAREVSKLAHRTKAVRRPISDKASLKGLSGLSIEVCRSCEVAAQAVARTAVAHFNTVHEVAMVAIEKGGDIRSIRSAVAALKAAVRTLEVRHIEFKFAREMVSISLARHSA